MTDGIQRQKGGMPAMLLAAGLGTRLAPLTDTIPKCLVPIRERPLLEYWLEMLGKAGMAPLVVNVHHHADKVEDFIASSVWRDKVILSPEPALLGTGGTLLANRRFLENGPFLAVHADNLSRFDVHSFLRAHADRPKGCLLTMMLFRTTTPKTCGIVKLDDRGVVTSFHEKEDNPPGNLANAAVYVMEPEVLDILEKHGPTPDISLDLIPKCMGRIYTWFNGEYHRDIGTNESYQAALAEF